MKTRGYARFPSIVYGAGAVLSNCVRQIAYCDAQTAGILRLPARKHALKCDKRNRLARRNSGFKAEITVSRFKAALTRAEVVCGLFQNWRVTV